MRIAHIDTERTWRGGQQQVLSLIQGLAREGIDNVAVVRKGGVLETRLQGKCRLHPVQSWGEWDFVAAHFLNRFLKREKVDLVHAHSGHGVALAVFSTMGSKIPVVATRRVDFHLANNIFSKWKYRRIHTVVAISEGVKTILLEDGIACDRIRLIPSGVDFERHQGIRPFTKEELGLPPDARVVGQVAALAPHKDQATFLKTVALLKEKDPRIYGVIVGEGPLRTELEHLAIVLGLESRMRFLGFKEDSLRYLASFDVFCLSSKEEGLGTSLIDALALKVPIVATRVGGIPEVIEDGVTGDLVPPQDPESMAGSVKKVLDNPNNKEQLQAGARKASHFDISKTVNLTVDLYRQILRT